MEVEVQHLEYSRDGWLHFLITRFFSFPIEPWRGIIYFSSIQIDYKNEDRSYVGQDGPKWW